MTNWRPAHVILDELPQAVSVIDADGRLAYANPAFWQGVGVEPSAFPPGTLLADLVRMLAYRGFYGAGDPEAQVAAVLAVDRSRPSRRQIGTADGSRSFETISLPLPDGGFLNVAHDITPLVRARDEQAARARLLEGTLARLHDGVVRLDAEMRLSFSNPAYEGLMGLPGGTVRPGMTHREVIRLLEERGEYADAEEPERVAASMVRDRDRAATRQRVRPGGEVLRFDSQPMPDGGVLIEVSDITALKRAEDEARRRAALLDGVLAALPYGVCVYGPDRRIAIINAAYRAMFGEASGEVGEKLEDLLARRRAAGEYDEETLRRAVARSQPGTPSPEPMRRVRPNGAVFENAMAKLPDGGLIAVFTDVTALHRAEEAARHRAELLGGVLRALPHGVCVYGPDQRIAMFNEAYARIMDGAPVAVGEHLEEVTARRMAAGEYDADYAAKAHAQLRGQVAAGDSAVRRRPNGTVIAVRREPLPDGGHISVVTDVTALHQAEEAARERAGLLDAVLEALPEGVSVFGPDGRARMINPAYRRIMGDAAVRPGESIRELGERRVASGELTPEMMQALLDRHYGPPAEASRPIRRVRPDGTAVVTRAARLPDGGHMALISDVTPLYRAEEELRRRAAMLEASFGAMRHGIAIFGPDRRLLAANDRTSSITGIPPERYTPGRSLDELVAEQVRIGVITPKQGHDATTLDRSRPHRYVRELPDGRVTEMLSDPTPEGGFIITFSDITALKRAEEELERRAAMLEASFAAMRHGFAIFGPDRRLLAANDRTPSITGIPPEFHVAGLRFEEMVAEQVARGVLTSAEAEEVLALDRSRPHRYLRHLRDGRIAEILSDPTPDGGFVVTFSDVTALHRAEEELQRRAAMLEASFGAMRHGIAIYGPDRRLLARNDRFCELTGLSPEVAVPGVLFDVLVEEQARLGVVTSSYSVESRSHDFSRPVRVSRSGPGERQVEILADPTPDGGFVVTFTDVTALRHAEAELERRAAMLEASFGAMRHGIAIYGPDRRLLAMNDRTAEMLGLPPEVARPGVTFDELLREQVKRGIMSAERAAEGLAADRARPYRNSRILPDGRIIEIVSDPTPDGGFVMTFTDVTALRRAEHEIRQREAMQAAMLGNIRHGIILYGPDRRLLATNAKTAELTGMPAERLLPGRTLDELLDEQVLRGQVTAAQAAEMKGLDRSRVLRYGRRRPDGRVIDTVSEPTPDGGFVITYSDVTEDRAIRAELERARSQAEAASEAKSRFLATMSHELRTPLNAVIGFSEAIGLERDAGRIAEYAAAVNEAGRHLLQLVDDILDVAGSQTGTLRTAAEAILPGAVMAEAAQAAAPAAGAAGLTFVTEIPPNLPQLRGDARRLRQLLDKLLSNAVKFTPAGGRVTLAASAGPAGLEIRVTDTGIGIPDAERERMFEPFTQLDSSLSRRFQGSGLGLHLARILAGALGGTLTLEGPDGPGITALLRFPADRLVSDCVPDQAPRARAARA